MCIEFCIESPEKLEELISMKNQYISGQSMDLLCHMRMQLWLMVFFFSQFVINMGKVDTGQKRSREN